MVDTHSTDIIAVQEIRWNSDGVMQKRNYDFYYSCHRKQHELGTGFLVFKRVNHLILDFKGINLV